jgi:hypothetical protein
MSTERVRHIRRSQLSLLPHFRTEIMNDDEDDEEAPAGPINGEVTTPASPSPSAESTPAQVSPASA